MNKIERDKAAKFLDDLTEFLTDSEGQSNDNLKQDLIEEGIDIDSLIERVKKMVKEKLP